MNGNSPITHVARTVGIALLVYGEGVRFTVYGLDCAGVNRVPERRVRCVFVRSAATVVAAEIAQLPERSKLER